LGSAAELPFMINFNFGKKKPDKKQLIIVSIVLSTVIATLSQCTGVSENGLWDLLDEIQRKYFPQTILNELILKDPDKIERRVKRDVDRAINEAIPEYNRIIEEADKRYKPRYSEKDIDLNIQTGESRLLGGEMRICAHWVDDCPKQ
jgi:hypothetical protein